MAVITDLLERNFDLLDRNRLALTYTEKMAACISASIDACDHEDRDRANHFSKMALRHAMQVENYLASAAT